MGKYQRTQNYRDVHKVLNDNYRVVPIGGHRLPSLPYSYNALEPYISERTMRIHHNKHHKGYVDGLNGAELALQDARKENNYSTIKYWQREVAFNGAGHYLHTLYWISMSPKGGGAPFGPIAQEIKRVMGGFTKFRQHFTAAAKNVEASGWATLIWAPRARRIEILQAEKHQNLTQQDVIPLLTIDVWEHAYYLQYQSNRGEYVNNWWNIVNWRTANYRFLKARRVMWRPY